jgi:hypothetical protein
MSSLASAEGNTVKNPRHEVVGLDVVPALHDDRVDHAGQQLLELLHRLLLGKPGGQPPE